MSHRFSYKWNLSDGYPAPGISYHGARVFGTFVCGGGSTMGYKLAGYDHLGGVEIDPKVAEVYRANHDPKYLYVEDIRAFRERNDLPGELFDLDLLDGSPPCSSFSTAGNRDKDWGKDKVFREGQAKQRLDDLFFEYIALAKRLQPKVVVAENVKGLVTGNAKAYVKKIYEAFKEAGYVTQLFLLNAASMGVPQKRERVFFVARRNNIPLPVLRLVFDESSIVYRQFREAGINDDVFTEYDAFIWRNRREGDKDYGDVNLRLKGRPSSFNGKFVYDDAVVNTIASAGGSKLIAVAEPKKLTRNEVVLAGSFPLDYNFEAMAHKYLIGMSVPPVMMAQIAHQIRVQWLDRLTSK